MAIPKYRYKNECDECGWEWKSHTDEDNCPECGSDFIFRIDTEIDTIN